MDSQPLAFYSSKKPNLVFGDNRTCISCRDKEGSVLLCEVLDCQVNLCPLMFNGDSFKLETCRSDNLWTRKFVYKKHFKEENWFPFINEPRNRTLWANGATGKGAKKHKLIIDRFNLESNWSFLSAGWEAIVKRSLKPSWRSWIPWLSPSSAEWLCRLRRRLPGGSGSLSFGILPALFHPLLITGGWFKRYLLAAGSTAGSNKQQGTGLALQEGLDKDSAAVKLLAAMSRVGSSSSSDDFQQAISR